MRCVYPKFSMGNRNYLKRDTNIICSCKKTYHRVQILDQADYTDTPGKDMTISTPHL